MARRTQILVVASLVGGSMSIPLWTASDVGANGVIAPSVALLDNGSPASSVRGGDTVTLRTSAPVETVGIETVEMIANWSTVTAGITGAGDVTAPAGWTTTYTTDGTNYVANPANWSEVIGVKATGPVASGGATATSGENPVITQSLTASAGGTVRPTLGNFQGGSAGDGWNAFHGDGYIFNIYHHANPFGIDCHIRASTGSKCWTSLGGQAFTVSGFVTGARSAGFADEARDRVWGLVRRGQANPQTGNYGFLCVDYSQSAPRLCQGVGDNGFVSLGTTNLLGGSFGQDGIGDLIEYSGRLYTKSNDANSPVLCLDLSKARECTGSPFYGVADSDTYVSPQGAWNINYAKRFGNRMYITSNQRFFDCFDLDRNLRCDDPAWPVTESNAIFVGPLFAVTSDGGTDIDKICMHSGAGGTCFTTSGVQTSGVANLPATTDSASAGWGDTFNHLALDRYYFQTGRRTMGCYDFTTGAVCAGYAAASLADYVYALTVDPVDVYCLWSNADNGANKIIPINALSGSIGCAPLNPTIDFTAPSLLTRLPCASNDALRQWSSLKVTPGSQLVSAADAKLTVLKDGQLNQAVAGFTDLSASAEGTWDLSGLTIAASGGEPKFAISWDTGTLTGTTVELRYESDPPQLCVDLTVRAQCPSGFGLSEASAFPGTPVTANGAATVGSGAPTEAAVTATAADLTDCLGTIAGTVSDSGSPIEGAMVTALMPDATLVQATTDAQGQYSIPRLFPGSYVVFCHALAGKGAVQPALSETVIADTTTTKDCAVTAGALRAPDITKTVRVGEAATFPIAGTGIEIDPTLTQLIEPSTAAPVSALSISGQPAWSIADGVPQTPAFDTVGTYRVVYQIETSTGEQARGLLTLDVIARSPGLPARPSTTIPSPTSPPSTTDPPVLRDPLPPVPVTLAPNGPAVLPSIPPGEVLVTDNGAAVETRIEQ
ncbi:MAG: Carboxypeptidase regulatory-like domain, partial [Actinomycetota bacterium]